MPDKYIFLYLLTPIYNYVSKKTASLYMSVYVCISVRKVNEFNECVDVRESISVI